MQQPRNSQTHRPTALRSLVLATAAIAVLGASGCSFFNKKDPAYLQSAETRPLEVPPDLNLPQTDGAMRLPGMPAENIPAGSVTRSSLAAPAGGGSSGFTMAGDRDGMYAKVGDALATIPGVSIATKAELLGVYDVSYEGANFLVRVNTVPTGVYVSAVNPQGKPATDAAPVKLIAALKAALGG